MSDNGPYRGITTFASGGSPNLGADDIDLRTQNPYRPGKCARGLYAPVAGDITVEFEDGTNETYTLAAGDYVEPSPTWFARILASGTTIASIRVGW